MILIKNIYLNFDNQKNIFKDKPSLRLLISSYLSEIAIRKSKIKIFHPLIYLKMILEMSKYIFPKLEFPNYYLAKILLKRKIKN